MLTIFFRNSFINEQLIAVVKNTYVNQQSMTVVWWKKKFTCIQNLRI